MKIDVAQNGKDHTYTLTIKLDQVYSNIENQIRMDKFQSVIDERIKNIKKDAKIIIK